MFDEALRGRYIAHQRSEQTEYDVQGPPPPLVDDRLEAAREIGLMHGG